MRDEPREEEREADEAFLDVWREGRTPSAREIGRGLPRPGCRVSERLTFQHRGRIRRSVLQTRFLGLG